MIHQITLPNSAFLGNFEKFLTPNTFPLDNTKVDLTSPYKKIMPQGATTSPFGMVQP